MSPRPAPAAVPPRSAAMSIDVEDWFQVENFRPAIAPADWPRIALRVEGNTERMLAALDERGIRATFFVLGWVADRAPQLVRRIAAAGHEVASHGYGHDLAYHLTPAEFRRDAARSKALLEDLSGAEVLGYRAPSFSIADWHLPILQDLGYAYDSSSFAVALHDRYGRLTGGEGAAGLWQPRPGFWEVSLPVLRVAGRRLPWAGGGWFRLIPFPLFARGVERILAAGQPYVFYIHPWEIDPDQPRVAGLGGVARFRHYHGLRRCEGRWRRLLDRFAWTRIDALLAARAGDARFGDAGGLFAAAAA